MFRLLGRWLLRLSRDKVELKEEGECQAEMLEHNVSILVHHPHNVGPAKQWLLFKPVLGENPVELESGGQQNFCRSSEKRVDILIRDFS